MSKGRETWKLAALLPLRYWTVIQMRAQRGESQPDLAHEYGVPLPFIRHVLASENALGACVVVCPTCERTVWSPPCY